MPLSPFRRHDESSASDERPPARRDRDRILYSSEFRRLAGITQVVSPTERHAVHNRLTHTLKVAQIGRGIVDVLLAKPEGAAMAEAMGGLDADVVEAAAFAHDLGHPPFGHVAEYELNELAAPHLVDGFEGNAQSFRIITRLAVIDESFPGLNLTARTLDGVLKYPWLRASEGTHAHKWGAYASEHDDFEWARQGYSDGDARRSLDAAVMDWADDVAYAVHDVDDFYRAGLIPLDRLATSDSEAERFLAGAAIRQEARGGYTREQLETALAELRPFLPSTDPYEGSRQQRAILAKAASNLIARAIQSVQLDPATADDNRIRVDQDTRILVTLLKELTWQYVIHHHRLSLQQLGQRRVIRTLFEVFIDAAMKTGNELPFPLEYQEQLAGAEDAGQKVRLVVDFIASMTEQQAVEVYSRVTGVSLGSVLAPG